MPVPNEPWFAFALLGLAVGVVAGMLGIGGGVLVIPALVFIFGFSHRLAVGTSLAMLLPPIGLFAILPYWPGNVSLRAAAWLAGGFALGGFLGGRLANARWMPEHTLRLFFAFFLLYLAGNILFRSDTRVRAAAKTGIILAAYALAYLAARLAGRRWARGAPAAEIYRRQARSKTEPDYEI